VEGSEGRVSAPAALTFTSDDAKLIAVGGKDNSVLQWNLNSSK